MAPTTISLIVFGFVFGGSLFGLYLGAVLPEKQLNAESRGLLKLGMGLMGTMTGLVLGLQLGSAVSAFDLQQNDLTQISAKLILLNSALSHYGPETKSARELLRKSAVQKLELMWPKGIKKFGQWQPTSLESDEMYYSIQALSPTSEAQRAAKAQALSLLMDVGQTRWLMFEQQSNSASMPLLFVLAAWLTVMFVSLGIFAPRTIMAITTLFVCATSVSCAIFLILELHSPLGGLIRIPSDPLRHAILYLGQ
jgi:hypothetical protein